MRCGSARNCANRPVDIRKHCFGYITIMSSRRFSARSEDEGRTNKEECENPQHRVIHLLSLIFVIFNTIRVL